jgi:hypothetical protein
MAQGFFPQPKNDNVVVYSIPIVISCQAHASSAIAPEMLVETIQTHATDEDRVALTAATADTHSALGFIMYNLANRKTLSENNAAVTKATTFAADDRVDVGLRVPVLEAILAAGQGTVLPGAKLVSAGSGSLKIHGEDLAVSTHTTGTTVTTTVNGHRSDITVAIMLSRAITSAATQLIQVLPMW